MSHKKPDQPPSASPDEKRICLGKITSPHGIKGLVKVLPYGEDPSLLNGTLYSAETGPDMLNITLKNSTGKYMLAEIENCTTREQAEAIAGTELYVARSALPEIKDEDSFYFEDLISLQCIDTKNNPIGTVLAVHNYGAGDLLEIAPSDGSNTQLILFNKENIGEVNLPKKTIEILKN